MGDDSEDEVLTIDQLRATWVSPLMALKCFPDLDRAAIVALLRRRLGASVLQSACEMYIISERGKEIERGGLIGVPKGVWDAATVEDGGSFWADGDLTFLEVSEGGYSVSIGKVWQFFGVRLDPEQLALIFGFRPQAARPADHPEASRPTSPGGRPPKPFWEPLLIEMARQLYVGDLKPKTQADIERAMHDWLVKSGHEAGETPVRDRARLLFKATR